MLFRKSIGGAAGDFLKPRKRELGYTPPDPAGKAERDPFCDAVGKLAVLANDVKKWIEGWMGAAAVYWKRRGRERAFGGGAEVVRIVYRRR